MPTRPLRIVVLVVAALIFFMGPSIIRYYTDWLWFGELGYQPIFVAMLRAQTTLFTIVFAVSALWLAANLNLALRAVGDARPVFTTPQGLEVVLPGRQQLRGIALGLATLVAILIGLYASGRWLAVLSWRHAVPFGQADPVLGHDVGFYVFSLPVLQFARGLGQALVFLAALGAGGVYLVSGSLGRGFGPMVQLTPAARRHLALLAAVFFGLLALGAWLRRPELLVTPSGIIFGASYADVHARMPAALVLVAAALAGVGLSIFQATSRRNWPIVAAIALYIVVSAAGEGYSTLLQRFVVTPNEQVREAPFIQHNIAGTRRAFSLDDVEARELSGDDLLTRDDITRNASTLENVRLWDHQPLLDTFGQLQEIRTYYDFVSVDNDRYRVGGALRQVMLSARELNSNSLPNRTWVNERLTFTHGYGLTLGPVNEVTAQGLPVLFIRDLPPASVAGLEVKEPSIYFGELSSDYSIVRTSTREFHYPKGEENVFNQYGGAGGVPLGSLWRKLIFALRFGAYQIVLSDDITPESRILFNRDIRTRLRTLAPFLTFDGDPYMVLVDGRLYWICDAYTVSGRYPYSTPSTGGVNYIRNAVKVTIDAYEGTTTLYISDDRDPIAATYGRIFPGTFKPLSEMPAGLREHVRYPEDIFQIQASVFATYHMTQPDVFYNREDQWEIPTIEGGQEAQAMQPYYTIMRLPGEQDPEFIQMLPFTPRRRDNLAAWLVARSDGDDYGRLRVFAFPKQKLIFGPRQIVARISQDQIIAPQITLWNQQGSEVIWGTLMVIPIEESLIYVRPLYLRGAGSRIPELTRVIVAHQDQIVMERTLDDGLERLFGGARQARPRTPETTTATPPAAGQPPGAAPAPQQQPLPDAAFAALAAQARGHYEKALAAQRAGDWATYGEEIKRLGEVLERMRQR
jgi:uncharacterized membrane protein (UPF0182 family)